ncbi:MAG: FKBP-type peptidyl-prolyl cis-trans isomerase [Janthinobacterium lividum]
MMLLPAHFCPAAARRLLPAWLAATALLLATSCQHNPDAGTAEDYRAIDDGLLKRYLAAQHITTAQRQASGLYFVPDSVNTTAPPATAGKTVTVLYTGQLLNGQVFDSNRKPGGQPFQFVLGEHQVIAGWDSGVALMHQGDKARLLIPSALAYGPAGAGGLIPPNAPLVFTVQVLDVQ